MYANDYLKSPTFHLLHCISKKWIRHVVIRMFVFTTGNAYIHALTMLGYTHLKIEVMTFDTIVYSIEYPNFQIGDSTENYMLRSLGTPIITSAGQIFVLKNGSVRSANSKNQLMLIVNDITFTLFIFYLQIETCLNLKYIKFSVF